MDFTKLSDEQIKDFAEGLDGFTYDKRIGREKLEAALSAYLIEHPEVLNISDDEDVPPDGPPAGEETPPVEGSAPPVDENTPPEQETGKPKGYTKVMESGEHAGTGVAEGGDANPTEGTFERGVPPNVQDTPPEVSQPPVDEGETIKVSSIFKCVVNSSIGPIDFTDGTAEVPRDYAEQLCELNGYDKC